VWLSLSAPPATGCTGWQTVLTGRFLPKDSSLEVPSEVLASAVCRRKFGALPRAGIRPDRERLEGYGTAPGALRRRAAAAPPTRERTRRLNCAERETFGEENAEVASEYGHLAMLYQMQERFADAEQHYRVPIDLYRQTLPPDPLRTASPSSATARCFSRGEHAYLLSR